MLAFGNFMKTLLIIIPTLFCLINFANGQTRYRDTTITSNKIRLTICTKDLDSNLILLTSRTASHTVLSDTIDRIGLAEIIFTDFNKDSYFDIMLSYYGNNPTYFLYLFDPAGNIFKEIEGFMKYPDAVQLKSNPKYYYSYRRAGCADLNWVSDLFKIVNFEIIQVGHIDGQGCNFEVTQNPQVIEIYKMINNDEEQGKLISKLPYLKHIPHNGYKWEFIEKYWSRNYQKFD